MTNEEYKRHVDALCNSYAERVLAKTPPTLDEVIANLVPFQAENYRVRNMSRMFGLTEAAFDRAMRKQEVSVIKQEKETEKANRVSADLGGMPSSAEDFVRLFVTREEISSTYSGEIIGKRDNESLLLASRMRLERDRLELHISDRSIDDAAALWLSNNKHGRLQAIRDSIQALPTGVQDDHRGRLVVLCSCVFLCTEESPAEMIADALRKTVWQIKRKLWRMPVTRHLMPVITGPQRTGKSTFVELFTSPVAELRMPATFDDLSDVRHITLWDSYVLILDEMARAHRADMDVVKNVVSAETLTRRPMGSNRSITIAQRAALIGTSNFRLAELIHDTTGLGRFVELQIQPDLATSGAWDQVKRYDWVSLWQSVDHDGPDPMIDWLLRLSAQQEENRTRDPVEAWLESLDANELLRVGGQTPAGCTADRVEIGARDAYRIFKDFQKDFCSNTQSLSEQAWGRAMLRMLDQKGLARRRKNNGWTYSFPVTR